MAGKVYLEDPQSGERQELGLGRIETTKVENKWQCTLCGRSYKTLATFLRHPCAQAAGEAIGRAFDEEDGEGLVALARAAVKGHEEFRQALEELQRKQEV